MARSRSKKRAAGDAAAPGISGRSIKVDYWPIERVKPYAKNPRAISQAAREKVAASIREFGFQQPIVVDAAGVIIAGHTRWMAAQILKLSHVPVVVAHLTSAKARAYRIADNRTHQETDWLEDLLADELEALQDLDFDLSLTGFDDTELDRLLAPLDGEAAAGGGAGSLAEKFMVPPFSVLNARDGWWQARKSAWLALGIQSELGRGENALGFSETVRLRGKGGKRARPIEREAARA
jgi:hypothetical protein